MMRLTLLALTLAGCASLDQFDVELSASATIPGTFSEIPGVSFPGGFPGGGEISKEIKNQGVESKDVKSARFTKGSLRVEAPEGGHLAYVKKFEIHVEAEGLEKKRIASVPEAAFASRPNAVDFVLDEVEMQPYITAASMKLSPVLELASRPSQDIAVSIDLTLFVDLTLID